MLTSEFPHGRLPVLDVDGKKLSESQAIYRYLALKFGLAGKGEWEQARVDEILDFQKTVYGAFGPYLYMMAGFREGDKDAARRDFLAAAEKYLPIFAKLLEQSPNGFFVPSGPTVADFTVADYLHTIQGFEPDVLKKYPELEKFVEKVYNLAKLKKYIEMRPKADL
ncbi:glutathione S-transferase-1 [Aphelenchoides avenae]|nr:glutathione S-transferase-1 [Aphelenchus avenae]